MNLILETDHPFTHVQQLFAPELARKHERSTVTIESNDGKSVFRITAQDTSALRAAMNSVTSVLNMYDKTKEATNDN